MPSSRSKQLWRSEMFGMPNICKVTVMRAAVQSYFGREPIETDRRCAAFWFSEFKKCAPKGVRHAEHRLAAGLFRSYGESAVEGACFRKSL